MLLYRNYIRPAHNYQPARQRWNHYFYEKIERHDIGQDQNAF